MADGKAASGWTNEMKMVFLIHLFDSGAATIDWSKATLPPGKKISAVKMMMRRLADSYRPQLDKLAAGDEAGEEPNNAKYPKASTKKKAAKGKKGEEVAAESDGEDELGHDDNTTKARSRAPRTKATNTNGDEDESDKRGRKKT
ncbi:hypothetical protein BFW01_g5295 [Lasiodiplodia theobromae]|uniref:Uncharacterized protein n=1 Tax=Lasiodiplodia theobromae TaxID=45133 RepID=A0A5N5D435_9PEZI|nr:uncharacterized protein LTHEOB_12647 [Lasiodiplodia theobromae]KAB2572458.1 hypothetical protein DBV05_g8895 [Lasiodiplodia theobromae]KAF4535701.1 hypothetical protein LTHEOB_12647 [Lasiodiplodia theobromae]KAF9634400.1 hypothetical protein BFW01_g5295 [Lasiodiplodia theobromae]